MTSDPRVLSPDQTSGIKAPALAPPSLKSLRLAARLVWRNWLERVSASCAWHTSPMVYCQAKKHDCGLDSVHLLQTGMEARLGDNVGVALFGFRIISDRSSVPGRESHGFRGQRPAKHGLEATRLHGFPACGATGKGFARTLCIAPIVAIRRKQVGSGSRHFRRGPSAPRGRENHRA